MFFLKTLLTDIAIVCILFTTTFIYLAYTHPEQLNRIVCQVNTTNDVDYALCRLDQKL